MNIRKKNGAFQRIIYFLLCLICFDTISAQEKQADYPTISPVSPEAAALVKAINYPVSYNTGVPSISVPLYEFKGRELSVPITLDYHAGGFKAKEAALTTGMGWALSCDLMITREINGGDDFKRSESIDGTSGGLFYNSYCNTYGWPSNPDLVTPLNLFSIGAGMIDTQPDKFYYKLLNKSGCFYLVKNIDGKKFVPVPYNGIKIECLPTGHYRDVNFRITDTDGTEYNYTIAESQRVYPTSSREVETQSCWKCTSIVSPSKKEKLNIDYVSLREQGTYIAGEYTELYEDLTGLHGQPHFEFGVTIFSDEIDNDDRGDFTTCEEVKNVFPFFGLSVPRTVNHSYGYDSGLLLYTEENNEDGYRSKLYKEADAEKKLQIQNRMGVSAMYLNENQIHFFYDNEDRMTEIRVSRKDGTVIRRIVLNQSSVGTYTSVHETSRTNYLDQIRVEDGRDHTAEVYGFDYTTKYPFSNYLKGGDAWGGVNKWTCSISDRETGITVPAINVKTKYYRSNNYRDYTDDFNVWIGGTHEYLREMNTWIDPAYALIGQLKRITYPTGGYTEFDFENNKAVLYEDPYNPFLCGGLRVAAIRNYNVDGELQMQKKYTYGDVVDAGVPNGLYHYNFHLMDEAFSYKQEVVYVINPIFGEHITGIEGPSEMRTTYMPNTLEKLYYGNGAPIYYTKVTEYDSDSNGMNGKKEYLYTEPNYFGSYMRHKIEGTNLMALTEEWRSGQLSNENTYKYTGNGFNLVYSKNYEYQAFKKNKLVINTLLSYRRVVLMGVEDGGSDYNRFSYGEIVDPGALQYMTPSSFLDFYDQGAATGKVCPVKITETSYEDGKQQNVITEYEYDTYLEPFRVTTTYPDGHKEEELTYTAGDYSTDIAFIQGMKARNMVGVPIRTERNWIQGDNSVKMEGIVRLFRASNPGQIEKIYKLAPESSTPSISENGFTIPESHYLKATLVYDERNNQVQLNANDLPVTTYLWGYDDQYPIAEIKGATYNEVSSILGIGTIGSLSASYDPSYIRSKIQELREHNAMSHALVSTFLHSPLFGPMEMTHPDGTKETYGYDGFGRLSWLNNNAGQTIESYFYNYVNN